MDSQIIAQEWFNIAEMDIGSAKYRQSMHPMPNRMYFMSNIKNA